MSYSIFKKLLKIADINILYLTKRIIFAMKFNSIVTNTDWIDDVMLTGGTNGIESYLSNTQDTIANNISLDQRATAINNKQLDDLFIADKLTIAQNIYNKLINDNHIDDFEKVDLFLELHSLAKPEYKKLFNIESSENGCQLFISNQLSIKITNDLIVPYLQADIEKLSTSIIEVIKNKKLNELDVIENIFHNYMLLNDKLAYVTRHLRDIFITLLLKLINFSIVNQNISLEDSLSANRNFSMLFNNNDILFLLLENQYIDSFKYTLENLSFSKNINLDASLCHESLINVEFYAEYSNNLLVAIAVYDPSCFRLLYKSIDANEEIAKNILLTDVLSSAMIPPDICFELFKKLDPSELAQFQPSAEDLDVLLSGNNSLLSYINQLTDKEQIKQHVLFLCTILQNLKTDTLGRPSKKSIIDKFKKGTAFYNILLYGDFSEYEQQVIDTFICKLTPTMWPILKVSNDYNLLDIFLTALDRISPEQKYKFYVKENNIFFVFFVVFLIDKFVIKTTTHKTIADKAKKLYDNYLNLENLKELVKCDDFQVLFSEGGKATWSSIEDYEVLFIKNNLAMLVSISYLNSILFQDNHDINTKWDAFFLFEKKQDSQLTYENIAINKYGLANIFINYFPMFYPKYKKCQSKLLLKSFIEMLDLGDYKKYFLENTEEKLDLSIKKHEDYLATKFNEFIEEHKNTEDNKLFTITAKHLTDIKSAYDIINAPNDQVAKYLVCIAYLFVYYSSAKKFGTESTSPVSLRIYASALLQKAYDLDKNCIIADASDNSVTSWQNKLLGIDEAYTCTNALAGNMLWYLKKNYPHNILEKILPIESLS
jgi:hypothetical protein